jgi:solute carrier family 25 S-adenosylmethionine transporter 26
MGPLTLAVDTKTSSKPHLGTYFFFPFCYYTYLIISRMKHFFLLNWIESFVLFGFADAPILKMQKTKPFASINAQEDSPFDFLRILFGMFL